MEGEDPRSKKKIKIKRTNIPAIVVVKKRKEKINSKW